MDKEFAVTLYRALMMVCRYLEKRYGLGGHGIESPDVDTATRAEVVVK